MATIFSKIVAGEIPCHKVAESDAFFAFLDINPIAEGHTLVIPKQEVDYLFDLDDEMLGGIMAFARKVAHAMEAAIPCRRIGMTVIGLEVPHAHIHLIPIRKESDMFFGNPKMKKSSDELACTATRIREKFAKEK
ncbi:MAG: HIT family protein [Tannerella sp.]|jgi:histidine triad (HIT) family protein|nr:HIT family protein [Tannerella sp.]